MKLILKGNDARYAVEQSLLAFFPQERPVYDPAAEEENEAVITLSQAAKYTTAVTALRYGGRAEKASPAWSSPPKPTNMKRSACASGR